MKAFMISDKDHEILRELAKNSTNFPRQRKIKRKERNGMHITL